MDVHVSQSIAATSNQTIKVIRLNDPGKISTEGLIINPVDLETKGSTSANTLSKDQIEVICKFKDVFTTIPRSGKIQIYIDRMTPFFGSQQANVAWVKSPECPEGTYSILHFTNEKKVHLEIDCRKTNYTELSRFSGEQGNIYERPHAESEMNLAISGNGYFVLQCKNDTLILTRDGRFLKNPRGYLSNKQGCLLLNENGLPFVALEILNSRGCTSQKNCIATLDPAVDNIQELEYLNAYSFSAKQTILPKMSVTQNGPKGLKPSFFIGALENLDNPYRGHTGVSWVNHPTVDLDLISCPKN